MVILHSQFGSELTFQNFPDTSAMHQHNAMYEVALSVAGSVVIVILHSQFGSELKI